MSIESERRSTAALFLLFAALAAGRWFIMSDPDHFTPWMPADWFNGEALWLTRALLNVVVSGLLLVAVPWLLFGRNARDWGTQRSVTLRRPWPQLYLIALMAAVACGIAAILLVPSVADYYPIYRAAGKSAGHLLLSEMMTLAMILATELFYRGIALRKLADRCGQLAVFLLVPIYVADHIGAPAAEIVGSAFTGILLGYLALKTRSIWPGFAIHAACAVAVDLTSAMIRT